MTEVFLCQMRITKLITSMIMTNKLKLKYFTNFRPKVFGRSLLAFQMLVITVILEEPISSSIIRFTNPKKKLKL